MVRDGCCRGKGRVWMPSCSEMSDFFGGILLAEDMLVGMVDGVIE